MAAPAAGGCGLTPGNASVGRFDELPLDVVGNGQVEGWVGLSGYLHSFSTAIQNTKPLKRRTAFLTHASDDSLRSTLPENTLS